ncbi:alpha/beta hydrolase [Ferruginibacter paludis]|uniref:alpha/beta hydrolase family protein n=1 Tax=Ferruginibacter paludis TaxID=1310417 RepID=UPI0025B51CA2|nr:alpha/beta fold hydrolase [Ferruginibacter paludis]MDN3657461.1 alpha/beta hydrolase [Ferruginibacter paludis]
MTTKSLVLPVSAEIGNVSAEYLLPEDCSCIIVLAHGAGAGMNHTFMVTLSNALALKGIGTFRFNFPFMEKKKPRPDTPAVAHQAIAAAVAKAQQLFPSLPLFVAGKSFGGRMSSQYLSEYKNAAVKGTIFYGFPLHPAGKPSTDRAEHLKLVKQPMLFLQGTKDALATWELIEPVCKSLKRATLVKIEGADHSFKAGKTDTMALLVAATEEWIKKKLKH